MKYQIKYSLPYDIYRYAMDAKDEDQLLTFLKMLRDEQAYGFEVVPEYTITRGQNGRQQNVDNMGN